MHFRTIHQNRLLCPCIHYPYYIRSVQSKAKGLQETGEKNFCYNQKFSLYEEETLTFRASYLIRITACIPRTAKAYSSVIFRFANGIFSAIANIPAFVVSAMLIKRTITVFNAFMSPAIVVRISKVSLFAATSGEVIFRFAVGVCATAFKKAGIFAIPPNASACIKAIKIRLAASYIRDKKF